MSESKFYSLAPLDKASNPYEFSQLKGKVVLIVNVASKCGFTPQYKGLEELNKKYGPEGLVILGFPCNQFAHQEPGSQDEIESFCQLNTASPSPFSRRSMSMVLTPTPSTPTSRTRSPVCWVSRVSSGTLKSFWWTRMVRSLSVTRRPPRLLRSMPLSPST